MVNKILFITLSNIGDVILTLPVLDYLRHNFPSAKVTVISAERPKEIFQDNPLIEKVVVYDKHAQLKEKIKLFNALKKEKFDLVVDLRNTFFGALLPFKFKTSPFLFIPKNIKHAKDRHLYKLTAYGLRLTNKGSAQGNSLYIKPQDEEYIENILRENKITADGRIIVIAGGARSHIKRWGKEKFAQLIPLMIKESGVKVILSGDNDDAQINKYIARNSGHPVVDLTGKTSLAQLAYLLKRAKLLIANDSAVLHVGSYVNIPVVAIFGPTNEARYGPWSDNHAVVKKDIFCRPCQKAQCRFGALECMQLIKVEDVLRQVRYLLNPKSEILNPKQIPNSKSQIQNQHKRMLIVRTDRIGDVLLSTPVIKALRDAYPSAYIAMMVTPYAREIVEGNPDLDEVILYDKEGKHKSWLESLKFALRLRKKKFDLAVVLHPANRAHLVTFFAGIRQRIGYNRKLGFLLTDKIKHAKQLGEKHELEYNLDLLKYLGIETKDKNLFIPIKPEAEGWVEDIFRQEGIKEEDKILAVHPGASCPSKIWPNERFAEAADRLKEKYGFKIIIVAGPKDIRLAENLAKNMAHPAINLAGKTSVSQLAGILKRCSLFISNDSGPVHIASALGTPVISIFGRNQKGLSPKRWGPLGKRDQVLHKEVGCIKCLAHNCTKEFACLKAITVEDVVKAADLILGFAAGICSALKNFRRALRFTARSRSDLR